MKIALSALLIVAGSLAAFAVSAQEPRTAVITFDAPTTYTDGSAIAAPISYRIYQGVSGGPKVQVATITETSQTISTGLEAGAEYCWEVTAVVNGQESARSNEACKAFAFPVPNTVTITVQ